MSSKKPALGRGLDALFGGPAEPPKFPAPPRPTNFAPPHPSPGPLPPIAVVPVVEPEPEPETPTDGLWEIPVEQIQPNPNQPRKDFDREKLAELAASIREKGILQPIIVRAVGDGFQIIAGERRWRASQMAGLNVIPALVRDFDDQGMTEAAIVENVQRDNLNPIEEARGYEMLATEFKLTQEQIAQKVGKSRVAVTNALRLLKLPSRVIQLLREGKLSAGQARPLLGLEKAEEQIALAESILTQGLSARDAESAAKSAPGRSASAAKKAGRGNILPADVRAIQDQMALKLGMKVRIIPRTNKQGKVEVTYGTLDDFQRLCEALGLD